MSIKTKINNPLKPFCYAISINGFDQVLMQSIDLGEFERKIDIHGDGDKDIKTPGRLVIPNIVLEKLVPTDIADPFFWLWFAQANTSVTSALTKDFTITQLSKPFGTPGAMPVRIWLVEDAWVHKFKPSKIGDMEEGNSLDTVTLAVNNIIGQKI
jgi:hypothetical protein